jgi:hypothetical protein
VKGDIRDVHGAAVLIATRIKSWDVDVACEATARVSLSCATVLLHTESIYHVNHQAICRLNSHYARACMLH